MRHLSAARTKTCILDGVRREGVARWASTSYNGLGREYIYEVIDHAKEYMRGEVHTNSLENCWSLLKRCFKGTYISADPAHLFRYVAEEIFRFNEREGDDGERFLSVAQAVIGERLTYQ